MMSRRKFMAASISMSLAMPQVLSAARQPLVRIGLVADPQFADIESWKTRYYRQSLGKLREAVETFNALRLDFCVNAGDLVDKGWDSYGPILKVMAQSRHRFYHLLGNHDFEVSEAFKLRVPGRLGLKRRYYSVRKGGFCWVMLDTTEVSTYAHAAESPEHQAGKAHLERLRAAGAIHAQPWNSAVGERQLEWFEATCRSAAKRGLKVLVFAHHPIYPPNAHNAWNADELLKVVERNRNVVAWINGHNHAGGFGTHDAVPFVTLKGMVETEGTNAFAVAEVHPDRLILTGNGREISRELALSR